MKQFIKPKERFSIGLDIGTQVIKIVKLKFIKDTPQFCSFDLEPVESDLKESLKKIKQAHGIESANIGVCGPSVVMRYVNFPRMNAIELKQALKFEAPKHIPFSVDEINLDGYILKENLPDNKILVLIAGAKKEFVNQRLKLLEEAGLKVNIIDIDSLALVNAFDFNYAQQDYLIEHKAVALLNIGSSVTNLNILENGLPLLSRDIHIAGNNFTQRLMEIFGMDFKSAEALKTNPDKERLKNVNVAMESVLTNLAANIRTSFDYYESQSTQTVAKIFLSGGGSLFLGLKDMLTNLLGIEVEFWNPLRNINLSSDIDIDELKLKATQLAVGVGLALRQ